MKKQHKTFLICVALLAIILVSLQFDLITYISPEYISNVVESYGYFGPLVFMVIYYFVTLLFISAALFTILAGTLFGPLWGSIYVIIAATLAAQSAFYISKYLGSSFVEKLGSEGLTKKMIRTINQHINTGGFKTFFILRCLFLPYIPLSYAAGLIPKAKPADFFWATLITNIIFSPAFVAFGDALTEGPTAIIIASILIILVLFIPKILKKFHKKNHLQRESK